MIDERDYLESKLKQANIALSDDAISKLLRFKALVLKKNEVMNLTAITEAEKFIDLHIMDSLTVLKYIPDNSNVIDVGTGAGFPGMVLKIASAEICISLLDSLRKRVDFLSECVSELELTGVNLLNGRAEEFSKMTMYREKYDICVSRAVAKLPLLCEYCIPYVKTGGLFIAMKSKGAEDELKECGNVPKELGCKLEEVADVRIPGIDEVRTLILFRKCSETPLCYPRKNSVLKKLYK